MISGFSSYGDTISIAAPGSEINSSFPEDSYKTLSGTSMAAPFVSAACAMAKALHNDASSKEIRALLLSSTKPPTQEENADLYYGYGLLNAFGILNEIPNNYNDYGFTDTPAIFMETDIYRDIAEVTITFPQESTVYYTLDGSQPNQNSFLYSDPIILTNTTTISAVAYSSEKRKSKTNSLKIESSEENKLTITVEEHIYSNDGFEQYMSETLSELQLMGANISAPETVTIGSFEMKRVLLTFSPMQSLEYFVDLEDKSILISIIKSDGKISKEIADEMVNQIGLSVNE